MADTLSAAQYMLLLSDPSPCLRYRVLTEAFGKGADDPEVKELAPLLESDGILDSLHGDAFFQPRGKATIRDAITELRRLAFLGFTSETPRVQTRAEYLLSLQKKDGSWPLNQIYSKSDDGGEKAPGYSMIPLQTALPLMALAACGYAADSRVGKAFDWLLERRLPDGGWPTGRASGVYGYVAGYRKLPHSRWGCRSNTTGVLIALSMHPGLCRGQDARRALDLLLGRETQDVRNIGFETARLIGAEQTRGFFTYFARFDPALVLELCWRMGIDDSDTRVETLINLLLHVRSRDGLWHYPAKRQASKWITYSILRSLQGIRGGESWVGDEPRTAFQTYPSSERRW